MFRTKAAKEPDETAPCTTPQTAHHNEFDHRPYIAHRAILPECAGYVKRNRLRARGCERAGEVNAMARERMSHFAFLSCTSTQL